MDLESKDRRTVAAYEQHPIDAEATRHCRGYQKPTLTKIAVDLNTDGKHTPVSPESLGNAPS